MAFFDATFLAQFKADVFVETGWKFDWNYSGGDWGLTWKARTKYDDWIPRNTRFNDGGLVTVDVGSYRPNAWGLHDMHGNVAEWTRTTYRPYRLDVSGNRGGDSTKACEVVRGGSWRDRPARCRSAFRLSYPAWQGVYNVGFRVIWEAADRDDDPGHAKEPQVRPSNPPRRAPAAIDNMDPL